MKLSGVCNVETMRRGNGVNDSEIFVAHRSDGDKFERKMQKVPDSEKTQWYFYIPSEEPVPDSLSKNIKEVVTDETFKTYTGEKVKKVVAKNKSSFYSLQDQFNKVYEGDIKLDQRFILDNDITFHDNQRIHYIDIETDRCLDAQAAPKPITTIAVYDSYIEKYIVWAWQGEECENVDNVDVKEAETRLFDGEDDMLNDYLDWYEENYPDIITGWYINDYDMPYLVNRMSRKPDVNEKRLSQLSWVYTRKNNKYVTIMGHEVLDMKEMYNDIVYRNPPDFTLETVADWEFDDFPKIEMPERIDVMWREHLEELLKYNKRDVALLVELDDKRGLFDYQLRLQQLVPMDLSKTTSNGMLIDNAILQEYNGEYVFPSSDYSRQRGRFEGGYVMETTPGLYDYTAVQDLGAQYPSLMATFNLSPETLVGPGDEAREDDFVIEGDIFNGGEVRFRHPDEEVGLLSSVVADLLEERYVLKDKRNKAYERGHDEEGDKFNELQRTYKRLINSFFGACAWPPWRLYNLTVAKTITYLGRQEIQWCGDIAEEECGQNVVYTDSVTRDTVVPCRKNGSVKLLSVKSIVEELSVTCDVYGEKQYHIVEDGIETLAYDSDSQQTQWKSLTNVVEHTTDKNIVYTRTPHFVATTTEDHSFVNSQGEKFSPTQFEDRELCSDIQQHPHLADITCSFTEELTEINVLDYIDSLTTIFSTDARDITVTEQENAYVITWHYKDNGTNGEKTGEVYDRKTIPKTIQLDATLGFVLGMFIGDGSTYRNGDGGARIVCSDKHIRDMFYDKFVHIFGENNIVRGDNDDTNTGHQNQLYFGSRAISQFFTELVGHGCKNKHLPDFILDTNEEFFLSILQGYSYADSAEKFRHDNIEEYKKYGHCGSLSRKLVSQVSFIMKSVFGLPKEVFTFNYREAKGNFRVVWNTNCFDNRKLKRNDDVGEEFHYRACVKQGDYRRESNSVYDLTVEDSHTFVDCLGMPVLHNTDSIFVELEHEADDEVEEVLSTSKEVAEHINKSLTQFCENMNFDSGTFTSPMSERVQEFEFGNDVHLLFLETEKINERILFTDSQKRYLQKTVWDDGDFVDELNVKGFDSVRSDTPQPIQELLEKVYYKILDGMKQFKLKRFVHDKFTELKEEHSVFELAFSKSLGKSLGEYSGNSQHVRAVKFSNEHLGTNFREGDVPHIMYVLQTPYGVPETDVVAVERDTNVEEFRFDWEKYKEKMVLQKLEDIFEIIDWTRGLEQHQLTSF